MDARFSDLLGDLAGIPDDCWLATWLGAPTLLFVFNRARLFGRVLWWQIRGAAP